MQYLNLQAIGLQWVVTYCVRVTVVVLTRWGRDKIAAISQTTFFKCIFLNENVWISLKIWLKCVPKVPINNIPALATSHYLNQWWLVYWRIYASLVLNADLSIGNKHQCKILAKKKSKKYKSKKMHVKNRFTKLPGVGWGYVGAGVVWGELL